jgi:hypothetical protein
VFTSLYPFKAYFTYHQVYTEKLYMVITLFYVLRMDLRTICNFYLTYTYIYIWFCITTLGNVYCAVRSESLYETDYISPLKCYIALSECYILQCYTVSLAIYFVELYHGP